MDREDSGIPENNMEDKDMNAEPDATESKMSDAPGTDKTKVTGNIFSLLFMGLGLCCMKVIARIILDIIKGAKFIFSELASLVRAFVRLILRLVRFLILPFIERMRFTSQMQKSLRKAKKEGGDAYRKAIIGNVGAFLFGENGLCYTLFNYIVPIVSVAFAIAVIRYGSDLEYGLCVEYNGEELGVIAEESDYETAAHDVKQRTSYISDEDTVNITPEFSLRIVSDDERFLDPEQLANKILSLSNRDLSDAYGIYIDGDFIGAVHDKEPVDDALASLLLNYKVDGVVRDVSFKNTVEYRDGVYLTESVMTEDEAIGLLTSKKQKTGLYVVKQGDSPATVSQKYNMTLENFERYNPLAGPALNEGQLVTVVETESYLPIQYVREIEMLSFLDYETMEVETSSLNVGTSATLVKGQRGEKRSNVEITYVDGVEYSRKTVSSVITKEPVMEQVGVGTYTAKPDSSSTKLYGSGQFGWPIDGGYISDTFISNRNHKGIDIAAPAGTDIYAAGDGVVVSAGWNTGGYGFFVLIDHYDGYQTLYGHCSAIFVTEGQTVTRGQQIAAVGTTGQSTGNHCHFEVRYMNMCYDPALFINTVDYDNSEDEDDEQGSDGG